MKTDQIRPHVPTCDYLELSHDTVLVMNDEVPHAVSMVTMVTKRYRHRTLGRTDQQMTVQKLTWSICGS